MDLIIMEDPNLVSAVPMPLLDVDWRRFHVTPYDASARADCVAGKPALNQGVTPLSVATVGCVESDS